MSSMTRNYLPSFTARSSSQVDSSQRKYGHGAGVTRSPESGNSRRCRSLRGGMERPRSVPLKIRMQHDAKLWDFVGLDRASTRAA